MTIAGAEDSVGKLRRVSDAADKTQATLNRFSGAGAQMTRGVTQVAGGIVKIGEKAAVAALVATGAAAKIAVSFEDAFAAVEKTVDGTPGQLDQIDQALRRLSTTIPVTFQGLTTIASEAGALGVATKDIAKFTEAVARTSAATVGLDPFQASEAFGKLSTIFGLTGDHIDTVTGKIVSDYDRLGSSLVALGNAGASSEADIIAVTKRFAAAGQIAGLSAAEVLGWSSALASLGPEAEAAGGALQRVFNRAGRNIGLMGVDGLVGKNARKRVETFAAVTGMTVDEFVALYTKDASAAMQRFIQGIGGMDQFQSARALFEAGVINQRDILAMQAFSQRFGILNDQLAISNDAWRKGTDLQAVSEKRFDTLKSKAIEFKNQVLVGAAAVGDGMLPALGRLVSKAKEFVSLHMGDLTKLGRDIGQAIDDIDWRAVGDGARGFVDILRAGVDLIKQIPPQISLAVAGFLGLNKLAGGALGAGVGNIVGGLGKGIANVILAGVSKVPVVGGIAGALTATRVFVVNWPSVGGVAGAAGGTPVVAGAGMGILAGLSVLGIVAALEIAIAEPLGKWFRAQPWWDTQVGPVHLGGKSQSQEAHDRAVFHGATAHWLGEDATTNAVAQAVRDAAVITGHGDDLIAVRLSAIATAANATATNTGLSATSLARLAGLRITGKVPSVAKLGEIGSASDPFGFRHLKAFAFGEISKPSRLMPELKAHIKELDEGIATALAKGDTATVTKLSETKAGLEAILRDVRAGTFIAGQKAYDGALIAAAAADRTTAAIYSLPYRLRAVTGGIQFTGIPTAPRTGSSGTFVVPHQVPGLAAGGIVRRRAGGMLALLGEGRYDEEVRPLDGRGGVTVDVHPAPVRLMLNGRELVSGILLGEAFTRRPAF